MLQISEKSPNGTEKERWRVMKVRKDCSWGFPIFPVSSISNKQIKNKTITTKTTTKTNNKAKLVTLS